MRQGFLHLKNGREIAVQSFLQQYHQRYIIIVTFLNVQYPIDPAVISLLNVTRQYLLHVYCVPKCVKKCEQRLVDLKIEQSGKPTSEKMTSHGSVSDLPADIVSVDRVLIRLFSYLTFVTASS